MLYSLDDIVITPSVFSNIEHRSECVPYDEHGKLPLFAAPMSCIIDADNFRKFEEVGINTILPRNIDLGVRLNQCVETFVALGLDEFNEYVVEMTPFTVPHYICVDIANGHMTQLFRLSKKAKEVHGDNLVLMIGNIANPGTFFHYADIGVDYVRLGIGSGNVCFVKNTKVTMANNSLKNIEDIKVGDSVKTLDGNQKVINTYKKHTDTLIKINDTKCTPNHKFLVINKKDKDLVTDDNIKEYSYWVEAKDLTKDMLLVSDNLLFKEINNIEIIEESTDVYDIEVENSHMFLANGNYVHNCTTSANTGVHYPMASLISDIYNEILMKQAHDNSYIVKTKLVADGGFKNFDQINKALALGADYVMLGQILAKSEEACGDSYWQYPDHPENLPKEDKNRLKWDSNGQAFGFYTREYYGMSTKRAQKEFGKEGDTTAEGISKMVDINYPIAKWTDNFKHYLRSAMSYTNSRNLKEFKLSKCRTITPTGRMAFYK